MNQDFFGKAIDLSEKKDIMLDMLVDFFEYCKTNGLKCYLAGGTLLGAVRHGGYIPWDDDIDLMMPDDDYQRLIELAVKIPIGDKYFLSSTKRNKLHMWPMLKLIDRRTILIEKHAVRKKYEREQEKYYGIYLDIFPMYGFPEGTKERIDHQKKINELYDAYKRTTRIMTKRPQDSYALYILRKMIYEIYCFPYRIKGATFYLDEIDKCIKKYKLKDSQYFGFACGITKGTKDHFKTEFMKSEVKIDFEGISCDIFAEYDEMLSNQYGNYMELPPENQRRYHPAEVYWRKETRER